jgi:hypothetical protein
MQSKVACLGHKDKSEAKNYQGCNSPFHIRRSIKRIKNTNIWEYRYRGDQFKDYDVYQVRVRRGEAQQSLIHYYSIACHPTPDACRLPPI